jgi:hypothetical protein
MSRSAYFNIKSLGAARNKVLAGGVIDDSRGTRRNGLSVALVLQLLKA